MYWLAKIPGIFVKSDNIPTPLIKSNFINNERDQSN